MKKSVQVGFALVALDMAAHFTENPTLVALWDFAKHQIDSNDDLHRAYAIALALAASKPDAPVFLIISRD